MKNILSEQCKHPIVDCLKQLKFGRPANGQKLIDKLIKYAKKESAKKLILLFCIAAPLLISSCASTNQTQTTKGDFEYGIDKIESFNDSSVVYWHVKAKNITPKNLGIISKDVSGGRVIIDNVTFDSTGFGGNGRAVVPK